MSDLFSLPILTKTPLEWVHTVKSNFAGFIQDHASCERKAAALAMSFVAKYSDRTAIIEPMVSLAREELEHFHQVFRLMHQMGIPLAPTDEKDEYVNLILKELRHGREERLLDRLIMSGIIEARGYERFGLLGEHLESEDLRRFYASLAKSEAGHYKIFERLAKHYFSPEEVEETIQRLAAIEARALSQVPFRAALH